MIKKYLKIVIILLTAFSAKAQLTVTNTLTPTQLVQNVLLGNGVTASNIAFTGSNLSRREFNGTVSNIGFTSGILLTTGNVNIAIGPNNLGGAGTNLGIPNTDPQLNSIATSNLNNAAILEFDFIPLADTIKFKYVFASEEYTEYVCSNFNDVFGFFISGPNPSGGNYTNVNIAQIPETSLPVAINTINPGVAGANSGAGSCTRLAYSNLYVNNNQNSVQYGTYYYVLTVPSSGQVVAKTNSTPATGSYDESTEETTKVFAGFFQIVRLKQIAFAS